MHRCMIVAAVSKVGQAEDDKASIPAQLADCRALCKSRGWDVVREVTIPGHSRNYNWIDEIVADCPQYGDIVKAIRDDMITLIVARDYDRLWRTDALRAQVTALCREHKVQVFALNQPVEPVEPDALKLAISDSAMILEAIGGVIAESENRTRVRRIKVGKEARARQGYAMYSSNLPFGYMREPGNPVYQVNEEQARWIRWIYQNRVERRLSFGKLIQELNQANAPAPGGEGGIWIKETVRQTLKNPFYKGAVHWGNASTENGKHEAIVSPGLWDQAQQVTALRDNLSKNSAMRGHVLLTGLLRCGFCGHAMSVMLPARQGHPQRAWRCSQYVRTGGKGCQNNYQGNDNLEEYIMDEVEHVLRNPELFMLARESESENERIKEEAAALEKEINENAARWQRWSRAYEIGTIGLDEMLGHRNRLAAASDKLTERKIQIESVLLTHASTRRAIDELAPLVDTLRSMENAELKRVYQKLIKYVECKIKEQPHIVWL